MSNLVALVKSELMPLIAPLGFQVVESDVADSFDNAYVTVAGAGLRLRIVRERSVIALDVAPGFAPNKWTDSAVLVDYRGLSDNAGFHDRDAVSVLKGIGGFVATLLPELQAVFDEDRWPETLMELESLKKRRAERLFG